MSFRLVSKSVTLNDLEWHNGRYFALFQRIRVASGAHCVKVHVCYLSPDEFLFLFLLDICAVRYRPIVRIFVVLKFSSLCKVIRLTNRKIVNKYLYRLCKGCQTRQLNKKDAVDRSK